MEIECSFQSIPLANPRGPFGISVIVVYAHRVMRRFFVGAILVLVLVSCEAAGADPMANADGAAAADKVPRGGLQLVDWLIIAVYASATIGLGLFFSRKQRSTKEYFVGGGNLHPFFIGVSLFATLLSTISYLSMPGEALGKGPVNLIGLAALPLIFFTVAFGLLPVYMRHRVTSAYELLELRLGLSIRLLGAIMFLALRLVWMTLLVYLAAKAMTVMLGIDYWIIDLDQFKFKAARIVDNPGFDLPGFFRMDGSKLQVAAVILDENKKMREEFPIIDLRALPVDENNPDAVWIGRGLEVGSFNIDPAAYYL